jgi:hypothetical protein
MTRGAGDGGDIWHEADRLYAAREAVAEASAGGKRIGVAELVRFLSDSCNELTVEAQRALFASPRLRADFQTLKARLRMIELPVVAAASAGRVTSRAFPGGSARVHPARREGQVYVVFEFEDPTVAPGALLLEDASCIAKRPLPAPDALGQVVLVMDRSDARDALFLQLLADPMATGSFLP